jgi:hypothetical protein
LGRIIKQIANILNIHPHADNDGDKINHLSVLERLSGLGTVWSFCFGRFVFYFPWIMGIKQNYPSVLERLSGLGTVWSFCFGRFVFYFGKGIAQQILPTT